jgi:hypothetical protein
MKVIFSCNAGNGIPYNTTEITRGISSDTACRYWLEVPNQQGRFTASGARVSNGNGATTIRGVLIINLVSKEQADALRDFISKSLMFIRPFRVTAEGCEGFNLGAGINVGLDRCYIDDETSTENMIQPLARGNKYTVRIPYVCFDLVSVEGAFP